MRGAKIAIHSSGQNLQEQAPAVKFALKIFIAPSILQFNISLKYAKNAGRFVHASEMSE